jgi:hypothetical protein
MLEDEEFKRLIGLQHGHENTHVRRSWGLSTTIIPATINPRYTSKHISLDDKTFFASSTRFSFSRTQPPTIVSPEFF